MQKKIIFADFIRLGIVSYIVVFILIAFIGVAADLLASRNERLSEQIYKVAFGLVALWCIMKYAIGPDINFYIPFYEETQSVLYTLRHLGESRFEAGFTILCSLFHTCGISFWGMTAIISVFYFVVIYLLFRRIDRFRTLALLMLVCLDYNLILMEFRQCLAVSFFYLFVLLLEKKHYAWAIPAALLSAGMHKSAVVVFIVFCLLYLCGRVQVSTREYILLGLLIIGLLLIPLQPILLKAIELLPLSASQLTSVRHHLTIGAPFQKILIVYLASIFVLAYYTVPQNDGKRKHWIIWCCVAVLVCLYPYWFLLNRLRSYFLPFLIVYVANVIQRSPRKDALLKQIYSFVLIAYSVVLMIDIPRKNGQLRYPTDSISLVTERFFHSEEELQQRQIRQAKLYWDYDYPVMIKRGIQ